MGTFACPDNIQCRFGRPSRRRRKLKLFLNIAYVVGYRLRNRKNIFHIHVYNIKSYYVTLIIRVENCIYISLFI